MKLILNFVVSNDRSSDELGEKEDVQEEGDRIATRRANLSVHIHDVADLMKGKEGDADREYDRLPRYRWGTKPGADARSLANKKVSVLKIPKGAHVNDD
jgi:hypothetical protein